MDSYDLKTVCVIGLGYVGLPLAVRCQERGYQVTGFDLDVEKIKELKAGQQSLNDDYLDENFALFPLSKITADIQDLDGADVYLIAVPTPVDALRHPDLKPVISASKMVAEHARKGALVVLESTVNPGVSEEIIRPIFEAAGFTVGKDIHISHCPERINPGDPKWNVTNIPRVVGSFGQTGLEMSMQFYSSIIDAEIRPMKHIREAEAVKILENSFRNINIAFVNEIAMSFDRLGIDVKDVIDGAATKPFAFMPHYPSCGVGGHCIPVDPHYLVERAKESGFNHEFLKLAIKTNDEMPIYTVERLQDALNEMELPMKNLTVGILGLSYKANVGDLRESPAERIIEELTKRFKSKVETFDPLLVDKSSTGSLEEILKKSDALVLATNHDEFVNTLTPEMLIEHDIKAIVDGKNCLNREAFVAHADKFIYRGIGR